MKRNLLSLFLIFCCCATLSAQDVVHHQRGEDLQQYLLDSIKFVIPEFQSGNISTIEQRVYFVAPDGNYQVLTNEDQVTRVSVKGRTFIKSQYGYVELLDTAGDVALGAVRRTSFFETEKKGAYGMASQTTSVTTIGTMQSHGVTYTLGADQTTPFKYKVIPYLYRNNKVYMSTRKNFQKCFPDKKSEIESYLKEHSVDFENIEEVTELFNSLSR